MSKIKELVANREKLAKYDELVEWKNKFNSETVVVNDVNMYDWVVVCNTILTGIKIPDNIKAIIVSALEAEIKKLDEE